MKTLSDTQIQHIVRHKTSAVILAGGKGSRLDPLTRERAKPAVPFGGVYRIIDFVLSNCLNSNLRKIHVLTQYKGMSLDRHINNGWRRYFCQELGEFIDVVPPQQRIVDNWYQGSADAVYQNIYSIEKENPEYVVILAGDHIYNMDYRLMIRQHIETDADVTVAAMVVPCADAAGAFGVMETDADNKIVGFEEKPVVPKSIPGRPGFCLASMGIYVFTARFLFEKLCQDANRLESRRDFGLDVIPESIEKNCVFAHLFSDLNVTDENVADLQNQNSGKRPYWRDVGKIVSYYEANMDLIAIEPQLNLYASNWPIRSYHRDLPPAKFVFSGADRQGQAINSVVGQGCIISGGQVIHSVLGHSVRVNSYATVEDSILFDDVVIGRGAKIRRCIIDRGVVIPPGMEAGFDADEDRRRGFHVSPEGIVVIVREQ
ncbi:MAG: glucose-1-phosphate adenylyltransferase [Thermoguttaceae bacterium]|nr:glucose-1-phosphate adenylyltransferase [Thermoguttaceae bacterium]